MVMVIFSQLSLSREVELSSDSSLVGDYLGDDSRRKISLWSIQNLLASIWFAGKSIWYFVCVVRFLSPRG